jgi:hypothetical protein
MWSGVKGRSSEERDKLEAEFGKTGALKFEMSFP